MYGLSTVARQSPVSGCKSRTVAFIRSSTQTPVICRGFLFAAPRGGIVKLFDVSIPGLRIGVETA